MSKYNLYNLSRARSPTSQYRTQNFFKQKWSAKSLLRAYHGEQVRERHWQKMFSRKLNSVVPMNPEYLARNDGSIESAGRGSGLVKRDSQTPTRRTPYMLQTFAPLERRLDIAVYRALFASSARQARQFVVHGAVTVNGKPVGSPLTSQLTRV
jgi:ribosomal protein S4